MEKPFAVLVPIDFSEPSRAALAHALAWAARVPCEIHLVHVIELHGGEDPRRVTNDPSYWRAELAQAAAAALDKIPAAGRPSLDPARQHVVMGAPAGEIIGLAERLGVTAIVMGSHGRTGLSHLVTGSIAESVVRHASCPVLCVKRGDRTPDPAVGRPILCAVDFSETARRAMQVAGGLAQRLGVELQLLHVYPTPAIATPDAAIIIPAALRELEVAADARLAEWVQEARAHGWSATTGANEIGWPPQTITRVAEERGCELIVIGTQGRTGLARAFLGSIAEKVMRTARCPVLAVHGRAATN